ncbi:MAG: SRPBCC family protein [Proteobacteria bacterium]|jgi:uncharacterized protein YndB with AHSA1/START domain|nr:SRPBCC family protein [Pseudomonadota bacterium]
MKKIIKPFIVSFVVLILILLGIAFTMPEAYVVERSVEIQADQDDTFALVADFSKWKEWSPWYDFEPDAIYTLNGEMGMKDSSMTWAGKIVGRGKIQIDRLEPHHHISMSLFFETPHKTEAKATLTFESRDDITVVTWSNQGELEYPFGRLFGPVLKKMIGKDIQQGLDKLKARAEE